uniref:Large ribosomal subunit protein mL45 n=2 Tax=Caenorhabditis tropicalis TaxID=1561998 RepID=A0A1I7V4E6_9PELO
MNSYVPPETPGSFVDVNNKFDEVKQRIQHKFYNWRMGTNRIRKKQGFEKFDVKTFCAKAEDIYVRAHKALEARDKREMNRCITEYAFAKMWPDVENGSVRFELLEVVEPSRVVAVRCFDNPPKSGNDIAQITVRMHTKQKLAVYDRFGGLILGSEHEEKDVVEYVVFENHIAVIAGEWRLHGKIYPKWIEPKQGQHTTALLTEKDMVKQDSKAQALPLRTTEKLEEAKKEKEANN